MIFRNVAFAAAALVAAAATAPAAHAQSCDRACMEGIAEQYLTAMAAHEPTQAPISRSARYTENGVELYLPDGLWRTATKVRPYRIFVYDPVLSNIGFFTVVEENGTPVLLSTRLRVRNRQITEIEAVIARGSSSVTAGANTSFNPNFDALVTPRPQFSLSIPPEQRLSRERLVQIADSYFTGIERNSGDEVPNFADDCHRLENAFATTNRPLNEGQTNPGPANFTCREAFSLGYYREDNRLRDRRFVAIDQERGLVFAQVTFDHDAANPRRYTLKDGREVVVNRTGPWTWMIGEIFQITPQGQISQVEAILLGVPYGMLMGWPPSTGTNGIRTPSYGENVENAAAYNYPPRRRR